MVHQIAYPEPALFALACLVVVRVKSCAVKRSRVKRFRVKRRGVNRRALQIGDSLPDRSDDVVKPNVLARIGVSTERPLMDNDLSGGIKKWRC